MVSNAASNQLKTLSDRKRVNYAIGMVLGKDDLDQEQYFFLNKNRLENRLLHGYGTVCGLNVSARGHEIVVTSGVAKDPKGNRIVVAVDQCASLEQWLADEENRRAVAAHLGLPEGQPPASLSLYVELCYLECETDPIPKPDALCLPEEETAVASRITETFELRFGLEPPAQVAEDAVRDFGVLLEQLEITREGTRFLGKHELQEMVRKLSDKGAPARATPTASPFPVDPVDFDGIAAYWRLDEGTGATAGDALGASDGVIEGARWTSGLSANSLRFDGVDDYVQIAHGPAIDLDVGDDYALEAWILVDQQAGTTERSIVDKANASGTSAYPLALRTGVSEGISCTVSDGVATPISVRTPLVHGDGKWHHVVCNFRHSHKLLEMYLDGELVASERYAVTLGAVTNAVDLHFGARERDEDFAYRGYLDEVAIYRRALTSEEVERRHRAGLDTRPICMRLHPDDACEILHAAMQVWVTEVRPAIVENDGDCVGCPPGENCVVIGRATFDITQVNDEWKVPGEVRIEQDERPILLNTRLLQEWLFCGPARLARPACEFATLSVRHEPRAPHTNVIIAWVHYTDLLEFQSGAVSIVIDGVPHLPESVSRLSSDTNVLEIRTPKNLVHRTNVTVRLNTDRIMTLSNPPRVLRDALKDDPCRYANQDGDALLSHLTVDIRALSEIADVTTEGAKAGSVIKYDGVARWIPRPVVDLVTPFATITELDAGRFEIWFHLDTPRNDARITAFPSDALAVFEESADANAPEPFLKKVDVLSLGQANAANANVYEVKLDTIAVNWLRFRFQLERIKINYNGSKTLSVYARLKRSVQFVGQDGDNTVTVVVRRASP